MLSKAWVENDEYRLHNMLRLPTLPFPIPKDQTRREYLLKAAYLQGYFGDLELRNKHYNNGFEFWDRGLVVYSPYNPAVPRVLDLSIVLK